MGIPLRTMTRRNKRQITINTTAAFCQWKDCKINLLDTPGFADFSADVRSALRVADGAAVLVSAPDGVEVMTEVYWGWLKENLPRIIFVNKMDRKMLILKLPWIS